MEVLGCCHKVFFLAFTVYFKSYKCKYKYDGMTFTLDFYLFICTCSQGSLITNQRECQSEDAEVLSLKVSKSADQSGTPA